MQRDKQYAETIYNQVKTLAGSDEKDQKLYGSMAHKLPVLIRTSGLAQALAFVDAKAKDKEGQPSPLRKLLDHLGQTLGATNGKQFCEQSRTASLSEYLYLTHHAMAALLWYKRFAQSVLNVDPTDDTDD